MRILQFDSEQEWLAERKKFVTGTDAAGLLGVGYQGPFAIFHSKMGTAIRTEPTPEMEFGQRVEPVIAQWYADRTHRQTMREPKNMLIVSDKYPWLAVSPDFTASREDGSLGAVEAKSVGSHAFKRNFKNGAPLGYQIQVLTRMILEEGRLEFGDIAALVEDDRKLQIFPVEPDPELEQMIIGETQRFWMDHMLPCQAPDPDADEASNQILKSLYPETSGGTIDLAASVTQHAMDLQSARQRKGELEAIENKAKVMILAAMGNATTGILPNGMTITRNWVAPERHWVEAHWEHKQPYPTLRIKNPRR